MNRDFNYEKKYFYRCGKYLYSDSSDFVKRKEESLYSLVELKRKYRGNIELEVPHIHTEHVTNSEDLNKCVYRGSLCCGCGSEYIVVSHTGEIRPCQMLPESWFSIKNKNALSEHIMGNFHLKELKKSIKEYYSDNGFYESNLSPCHALELFAALEEERYVHKL